MSFNTQQNTQYEVVYGIPLMDDIHNYFPALLYSPPSSFSSVRDLLNYIQTQVRNRFDLFSNSQRLYRQQNPQQQHVQGHLGRTIIPPSVVPVRSNISPVTISVAARDTLPVTNRGVQQTTETAIRTTPDTRADNSGDESDLTDSISQLLVNLMNFPTNRSFSHTYNIPLNNIPLNALDALMEPVVVRPTGLQLTENTSLGYLASDNETCAICQEVISRTQEIRRIHACQHCFHRSCVDTWFERNVHCPICRHDVRIPSVSTISSTRTSNNT